MKKILIILCALCIAAVSAGAAEEMWLEVKLERESVSPGNPLYLYATFHGAMDAGQPKVSPIDGVQIKYVGSSTKMSVVNGKADRAITHTYLIIPLKGGKFTMGPFITEYRGKVYKAAEVNLSVNDVPSGPMSVTPGPPVGPVPGAAAAKGASGSPQEREQYAGDKVFLRMEVDKRRVYVNEMIHVRIKIYVDGMGLKEIEYPTYQHDGFSSGEFSEPEKKREGLYGVAYDTLVFDQDIFAIKDGRHILGPASLNCVLVVRKRTQRRSSFFGRSMFDDDFFSNRIGYETYPIEIKAEEIAVEVLPFPAEGRPAGFEGAVGEFGLEVQVEPPRVNVGDPVVLRMTVKGMGNLDTVTAPKLGPSDKFKTYEPQVEKKAGMKVYEQVLIPRTDDVKEIPQVTFSCFDPTLGRYRTITKGPFPLEVTAQPKADSKVKMVSMPGVEDMFYPQEELGKDIIHIKEDVGKLRRRESYLYEDNIFRVAQVVPLALFVIFYAGYRRKERILTDRGYARSLKAPRKARKGLKKAGGYIGKKDPLPFYDTIFKTLQGYVGDRLNLSAGSVTERAAEDRLREAGCDAEILGMLRDVLSRCEMARYASSVPGGDEAKTVLEQTRKVIDHVERLRL